MPFAIRRDTEFFLPNRPHISAEHMFQTWYVDIIDCKNYVLANCPTQLQQLSRNVALRMQTNAPGFQGGDVVWLRQQASGAYWPMKVVAIEDTNEERKMTLRPFAKSVPGELKMTFSSADVTRALNFSTKPTPAAAASSGTPGVLPFKPWDALLSSRVKTVAFSEAVSAARAAASITRRLGSSMSGPVVHNAFVMGNAQNAFVMGKFGLLKGEQQGVASVAASSSSSSSASSSSGLALCVPSLVNAASPSAVDVDTLTVVAPAHQSDSTAGPAVEGAASSTANAKSSVAEAGSIAEPSAGSNVLIIAGDKASADATAPAKKAASPQRAPMPSIASNSLASSSSSSSEPVVVSKFFAPSPAKTSAEAAAAAAGRSEQGASASEGGKGKKRKRPNAAASSSTDATSSAQTNAEPSASAASISNVVAADDESHRDSEQATPPLVRGRGRGRGRGQGGRGSRAQISSSEPIAPSSSSSSASASAATSLVGYYTDDAGDVVRADDHDGDAVGAVRPLAASDGACLVDLPSNSTAFAVEATLSRFIGAVTSRSSWLPAVPSLVGVETSSTDQQLRSDDAGAAAAEDLTGGATVLLNDDCLLVAARVGEHRSEEGDAAYA